MNLQHQPVVEAHARHLGEHLAAEQLRVAGTHLAAGHAIEQRLGIGRAQVGGTRGGMAVIRRSRTHHREERAALAMRGEIAAPCERIFAGELAELLQVVVESVRVRIDDIVRPVGRDDAAVPAALANGDVVHQVVERRLGGGQRLDVETFEQRARTELRLLQFLGDGVVGLVGVGRRQRDRRVEHARQHPVEPHARGRAAEQVVVAGKQPPDLARIALGHPAIDARHAEVFELDALAVEHAKHVVIGREQQAGRIGERHVVREPFRIGMPVRADDRQVLDEAVEFAGDGSRGRVDRKQPIGIEFVHIGSMRAPSGQSLFLYRGGRH